MYKKKSNSQNVVEAVFDVSRNIYQLGKSSHYNPATATNELIDNELDAGATKVSATFPDSNDSDNKITVEGNGNGMDEATLVEKYFGFGDPHSTSKSDGGKRGSYGMGGKEGIVSYAEDDSVVSIETKQSGKDLIDAFWRVPTPKSDKVVLNYQNLGKMTPSFGFDHGTRISFQKGRNVEIDLDEMKAKLSLYHAPAIQKGKQISINGEVLKASDPLYRNILTEVNTNTRVFTLSVTDLHTGHENKYAIEVSYLYVPADTTKLFPKEGVNRFDKYNSKNNKKGSNDMRTAASSGIFIKTGDRYYTIGNNFEALLGLTTHASAIGCRIEISIPKELWGFIGMTWNKGAGIEPLYKIPMFKKTAFIKEVKDWSKKSGKFEVNKNYKTKMEMSSFEGIKYVPKGFKKNHLSDVEKGSVLNHILNIFSYCQFLNKELKPKKAKGKTFKEEDIINAFKGLGIDDDTVQLFMSTIGSYPKVG